jgi:hypothetical protein
MKRVGNRHWPEGPGEAEVVASPSFLPQVARGARLLDGPFERDGAVGGAPSQTLRRPLEHEQLGQHVLVAGRLGEKDGLFDAPEIGRQAEPAAHPSVTRERCPDQLRQRRVSRATGLHLGPFQDGLCLASFP